VKSGGKYADEQIRWHLKAVADASREWMVPIEPIPFVIGRDDDCSLQLTDKRISRRHCEIRTSADHLWIRDLGSTNGTFVNHRMIEQAELLESDDIISIGKFRFRLKSAKSTAASLTEETCVMDISKEFSNMNSFAPKLQALLRERNVIPYFQPVISITDMTVVGYEVLGRVADRDLPSEPSELLVMAGWLGYEADLSALFREVGVDIGRNLAGSPLLFVNTTPSEVYQTKVLLESLKRINAMAPANRIILEINEKAATDTDEMARLRNGLAKLNIGLAFDDFGVGQTRLVELAKVPPDFLKFDISLIHQIHLAPKRLHQMVSTFVTAAQDLGIATLAEGIECSDEAETCQRLGFNFAQGYFYGRPLPISEIDV
jgi:EAL domain-containing protein (putative c-di-GMP-specific phosphodiesterase class I)